MCGGAGKVTPWMDSWGERGRRSRVSGVTAEPGSHPFYFTLWKQLRREYFVKRASVIAHHSHPKQQYWKEVTSYRKKRIASRNQSTPCWIYLVVKLEKFWRPEFLSQICSSGYPFVLIPLFERDSVEHQCFVPAVLEATSLKSRHWSGPVPPCSFSWEPSFLRLPWIEAVSLQSHLAI